MDMDEPRKASDIDKHVGRQLRALRMERKLSQEMVGDFLGVTFQQVQKYERGDNRIGAGRLFRLAQLFGVSVKAFYEGLENPDKQSNDQLVTSKLVLHPRGMKMALGFLSIDNADLEIRIVELCRAIGKAKAGQGGE